MRNNQKKIFDSLLNRERLRTYKKSLRKRNLKHSLHKIRDRPFKIYKISQIIATKRIKK